MRKIFRDLEINECVWGKYYVCEVGIQVCNKNEIKIVLGIIQIVLEFLKWREKVPQNGKTDVLSFNEVLQFLK